MTKRIIVQKQLSQPGPGRVPAAVAVELVPTLTAVSLIVRTGTSSSRMVQIVSTTDNAQGIFGCTHDGYRRHTFRILSFQLFIAIEYFKFFRTQWVGPCLNL